MYHLRCFYEITAQCNGEVESTACWDVKFVAIEVRRQGWMHRSCNDEIMM